MRKNASLIALTTLLTSTSVMAHEPGTGDYDGLRAALTGGRTWLNLRYRFEDVDVQAGSGLSDGTASTLRTVLGYETGTHEGFKALLEFEDTAAVLDDSVGAIDPAGGSVNQLYVEYGGVENLVARVGRQEVSFDNERFVGNVGWRQNHQSFDAVRIGYTGVENLVATYVYVDSVSTPFGPPGPAGDIPVDDGTHLINAGYDLENVGRLTGYIYRIDSNDLPFLSTTTVGVRLAGGQEVNEVGISYVLEVANQRDTGNNPASSLNEDYANVEVGGTISGITGGIQYERLGASNDPNSFEFTTPLATSHSHNGYADVFAGATPTGTGLRDLNVSVSGEIEGVTCALTYHMFDSDNDFAGPSGPEDEYGSEVDFVATYAVNDHTDVGFKYADFHGKNGIADVRKIMLWVDYSIL